MFSICSYYPQTKHKIANLKMQFSIFLRISVQSAENKTCLEFNSTVICQFSLDERLSVAHKMIYWQIPAECQLCSRSFELHLTATYSVLIHSALIP